MTQYCLLHINIEPLFNSYKNFDQGNSGVRNAFPLPAAIVSFPSLQQAYKTHGFMFTCS